MNQKRVLLIGLGNLGTQVFDEFVRVSGGHHFLVGGRNVEYLRWRTNISVVDPKSWRQAISIAGLYCCLEGPL